jgi:hypothetical protein
MMNVVRHLVGHFEQVISVSQGICLHRTAQHGEIQKSLPRVEFKLISPAVKQFQLTC